jgi:hypothetical protein
VRGTKILWILALASCGRGDAGSAAASPVSTLGTVEVAATLVEIPGEFPQKKLYDYVYVMKYRVVRTLRGKTEGEEILVGHYNPLKPRSSAEDKFSGKVGGRVERFQVGDVHHLALDLPLDDKMPMVGLIDKYIARPGTRYWAIWTDPGD